MFGPDSRALLRDRLIRGLACGVMDLPVMPPVKPMLCKTGTWEQVEVLLESGNGKKEPKWDGF